MVDFRFHLIKSRSQIGILVVGLMFLLAACMLPIQTPSAPPETQEEPASAERVTLILAKGKLELLAAQAFGQPGFHETFRLTHTLPNNLRSTDGMRLVIALSDIDRPQQTCSSHHPLSGCATIDWSDSPSRPHVPPSGIFDNSLTFQLASGEQRFYLSESGILASEPDTFDPGWPHTAVGGSAQTWEAELPADLISGSEMVLNLVMTKFSLPMVQIAYEVRLEPIDK